MGSGRGYTEGLDGGGHIVGFVRGGRRHTVGFNPARMGPHRRIESPKEGYIGGLDRPGWGGTHQWIGFLCSPNSSMVENIVHLKMAVRYESRGLGDVL
jgi:hypothetical protein